MRTQQIVVPPRPLKTIKSSPPSINPQDADFHVHPHLTPHVDPIKGRLLRASSSIPAGTIVLKDTSYATIPLPSKDNTLICSNLTCSRRTAVTASTVCCPRNCDKDVMWCTSSCRLADLKRHEYECQWLKTKGQVCRSNELPYDFITLWHVVRLLAGWSLEIQNRGLSFKTTTSSGRDERFKWNWEAVLMCCDYLDSWPESQLKHWKRLTEVYMMDKLVLPCPLNLGGMVSLICKEETNTFGLYPTITGVMGSTVARGEPCGLSLYPRAAQFNHSCEPNVAHKPDSQNRMVYTAARDIEKGDECSITYFDLTTHYTVGSRQGKVQRDFRFKCSCDKCIKDEAEENLADMESLPFGDL